jgi:eukaryotic-like serine/threonine-protein kinase
MVDIDHFKAINDTHGHQAGDDVISTVAARLATELGPHGLLARYGGEEFALLLTHPATLDTLPERLRVAVSADPVPTRAGQLPVTASVGVARGTGEADLTTLLARADSALYEAKKQGRNRVAWS